MKIDCDTRYTDTELMNNVRNEVKGKLGDRCVDEEGILVKWYFLDLYVKKRITATPVIQTLN